MATTTAGAEVRPHSHRENRKKNRERQVEDNQARAVAKFIRVPPRKARLVMDEIRGKYVAEALQFLNFIPNRAAGYIYKVIASAAANAANNHGLNENNLKVMDARVDEGPRMKRVQPRAQGRAYRILKRMSHISIIVQEVEPKPVKPKKAVAKTGSRADAARAAKQAQTKTSSKPAISSSDEKEPVMPVALVDDKLNTPEPVGERASSPALLSDNLEETASPDTQSEVSTDSPDSAVIESESPDKSTMTPAVTDTESK